MVLVIASPVWSDLLLCHCSIESTSLVVGLCFLFCVFSLFFCVLVSVCSFPGLGFCESLKRPGDIVSFPLQAACTLQHQPRFESKSEAVPHREVTGSQTSHLAGCPCPPTLVARNQSGRFLDVNNLENLMWKIEMAFTSFHSYT